MAAMITEHVKLKVIPLFVPDLILSKSYAPWFCPTKDMRANPNEVAAISKRS